ncbi:MAG: hypothetical protein QME42_10770 [bacterium]|nr:hypothetical protein [bacterium]
MKVVIDTDILSCIAKIKRFDLLKGLFGKVDFIVPNRVYDEVIKAKKKGYEFVDYIINLVDNKELNLPILTKDEMENIIKIEQEEKLLGFGEIEAITLAKRENTILLSNDNKVNKKSPKLGVVNVFNIEDIIALLIKRDIIKSGKEALEIINEIERKDRIKVRNKNYLVNLKKEELL